MKQVNIIKERRKEKKLNVGGYMKIKSLIMVLYTELHCPNHRQSISMIFCFRNSNF